MFLLPILTSGFRAFAFLFIFTRDTPDYYIMNNQKDKAEEALTIIYKPEWVEDELIMTQILNKSSKNVTFTDLFTNKYAYRLALGFVLPVI